jgi:K+-sensing histidine kinase KdpD
MCLWLQVRTAAVRSSVAKKKLGRKSKALSALRRRCTQISVLFYFKNAQQRHHLIFFYLFPTVLVAMIYGGVLSMVCATFATLVAAFLLYDPIYSLYVSDPRDVGELILFAVTGLIGAKCIA